MKREIFAIDSTTLQLSLDCIDWARHRRKKAAAKTHLTLDVGNMLPSFACVDDAAHHDSRYMDVLCAALKDAPGRSPWSATSPLGRSTESTGTAAAAHASAKVATARGRPPREPSPSTASMTSAESARDCRAPTASTSVAPARRAASRPAAWPEPPVSQTNTGRCSASSAAANRPSPPLFPGPTTTRTAPSGATAAATRATSAAARPIRSTSGSRSKTTCSAARICAAVMTGLTIRTPPSR